MKYLTKKITSLVALAIIITLCGCLSSSTQNKFTTEIEYMKTTSVDYKKVIGLDKKTTISTDISPEFTKIGKYTVKVQESKKFNSKKDFNVVEITVKDSTKPEISLSISKKDAYEVSFDTDFDLESNVNLLINEVNDKYSGQIKTINIVKKGEDFTILKDNAKKAYNTLVNTKITDEKKDEKVEFDVKSNTLYAYSDIDTSKSGKYTVSLLAVDSNYLISEASYNIVVLEKDKEVNNDKIMEEVKKNSENKSENTSSGVNESTSSGNEGGTIDSSSNASDNVINNQPTPTPTPEPQPQPTPQPDITDVTGYASELFSYVNSYRIQKGLPALQAHGTLQSYANIRANEIMSNFSHYSAYDPRTYVGLEPAGENIAQGTSPSGTLSIWQNSAAHNSTMLNPLAIYGSIGVVKNSNGQTFWVLVTSTATSAESGWQ